MENNDIQIAELYLNNQSSYIKSKPYPRSDTYGRDGWFYQNTLPIPGQTQPDRKCNINIYNELSAKVQDDQDISNFLQVGNIDSLSLKLIINGAETINNSTDTIQSYYPYITIGTVYQPSKDNYNLDYHSVIQLFISPTKNNTVNDSDELVYFYKNANAVVYHKNKPIDLNGMFNDNFKSVIILGPTIPDNPPLDINNETIKDIFITTPDDKAALTVAFLLQEAELVTKNMTSKNFTRKIKFKNIITSSITNTEELVLFNSALSGLSPLSINTYGRRHLVIYCNLTSSSGGTSKNVFLSYSSDNITYYTDSRNIICQEFDTPGTYTGTTRFRDIGFQYVKIYVDEPSVTNVKIAYSTYN